MTDISIEHVTKRYGAGSTPIDDVSLEIADGEFVIIVGPSGSGKSTLLQMIVGLLDITEGDLYIDGERVNDKAPRDRDLAMVFQSYALYPHLTAFENIAFPLRLRKVGDGEVRRRVGEVAQMLELTDFLGRKPANLSGGQRQRVAMGRAIVREAKAFLFDEPLSNLDAQLRGQVRTEIARLQKQLQATTVYVTHDQTEAMTLGDRIAVLRAGVLQQVGSPQELYQRPVNLFVAGFIGSPPMNFFPATVDAGFLRTPFGDVPFEAERLSGRSKGGDLLIAGIRPEEVHRASGRDVQGGHRFHFTVRADVVEWLGDEQLVYVPFQAPEPIRQQLADLARELDAETPKTQLVVKLGVQSKIVEGAEVELAFDPRNLHLFDRTGQSLTLEARRGRSNGRSFSADPT